jgi:molybdenum cofactor biosynthesis enzyme MoaA
MKGVLMRKNEQLVEEYTGCQWLEGGMVIGEERIRPCCSTHNQKNTPATVTWQNNFDDTIAEYIKMRDRLIYSVKNGEPSECFGCCDIKNGMWHKDKRISEMHFGFNYPCQLSCCYCTSGNVANYHIDREKQKFIDCFDWSGFFTTLECHNLVSDDAKIVFASGELTINPRIDEILDATQKYRITLATNAIKYSDRIAALTARDGNFVNVSVDAGTSKTYQRIKGKDLYNVVWENIKKYVKRGSNVIVKYIFIEENSNDIDVGGFIRQATATGVKTIHVSADAGRTVALSQGQMGLMATMITMAEQNNMSWKITNMVKPEETEAILQHDISEVPV